MKYIALDATVLNLIQSCARKYNLSMQQDLEPLKKAAALEKGDLMHKMLAPYYWSRIARPKQHHLTMEVENPETGEKETVPHPFAKLIGLRNQEVIEAAVAIGRNASFDFDIKPEEREETIRQFVEYAIHFAGDGWRTIEVEQSFSKILHVEPDVFNDHGELVTDGLTILAEGVIDYYGDAPRLGEIVVDHKTTSRRETPSDLSNQFSMYSWAMETRNVIVNRIGFQKTLAPAVRFQRIVLNYPMARITEWRYWAIYWVKLFQFYLDNDIWPPNFTSCDKYSGCIFKPVCEAVPEAREGRIAVLFHKGKKWSPHDRDQEHLEGMVKTETVSLSTTLAKLADAGE